MHKIDGGAGALIRRLQTSAQHSSPSPTCHRSHFQPTARRRPLAPPLVTSARLLQVWSSARLVARSTIGCRASTYTQPDMIHTESNIGTLVFVPLVFVITSNCRSSGADRGHRWWHVRLIISCSLCLTLFSVCYSSELSHVGLPFVFAWFESS